MTTATPALEVTIIEDNPGDVFLIKMAMQSVCTCQFQVAADGDLAAQILERTGVFTNAGRPDLVILDLNLPGKDGHEILELIRALPDIHSVPVVVLSSSPKDVLLNQRLRADCYFEKPADLDQFLDLGPKILAVYKDVHSRLPSRSA